MYLSTKNDLYGEGKANNDVITHHHLRLRYIHLQAFINLSMRNPADRNLRQHKFHQTMDN